jgi:N utilization substance protein B
MISSLMEICKKETDFLHKSSLKHLATLQNASQTKSLLKPCFRNLAENNSLSIALETRKIDAWHLHEDYISLLLNAIKRVLLSRIYE